jgi:hypothetical protein
MLKNIEVPEIGLSPCQILKMPKGSHNIQEILSSADFACQIAIQWRPSTSLFVCLSVMSVKGARFLTRRVRPFFLYILGNSRQIKKLRNFTYFQV